MIDEETALDFASGGSIPASTSAIHKWADDSAEGTTSEMRIIEDIGNDRKQISITIKKSLYERIAKDAARKNRTIDEHLKRHLAKHYGK